VYDVIFHPDTLYLAGKDARMKELVHSTAWDALETSFGVRVDRSQARLPKMSFKGVFRPTVIRKPLAAAGRPTLVADDTAEGLPPPQQEQLGVIVPSYTIRYRSNLDLQDFVIKEKNLVKFLSIAHFSLIKPSQLLCLPGLKTIPFS
jgi:hypothetical protein